MTNFIRVECGAGQPATSVTSAGTSRFIPACQPERPTADHPLPFSVELIDSRSMASAQMNKLKVLITDDSKALRARLAEMLSQIAGLEIVASAATVSEAFAAIHRYRPDLIVLDLQIGVDNGIEILRATKAVFPNVTLVVLTNQIEPQYRQRCADLGADYFLCKSTDANLLIEIARKQLLKGTSNEYP